ncbi:hypothetical protein QUF90_09930 [Desulfococcaceae bacterium HSG9]|nr:hypothetical protein [Desulfococcaceae bacterium HSG9]
MIADNTKYFKIKSGWLYGICLLIALLFISYGCTTVSKFGTDISKKTKKVLQNIKAPKRNLNKKIGFILFENKTLFKNNNLETVFTKRLGESVKQHCPSVTVVMPEDKDFPDILTGMPRHPSGRIDNMVLANMAKQLGLSAIVTGSLHDISEGAEEKGILWFKDTHNFISTKLIVEVFDSQSAAKLLDNVYVHESEVGETEYEMMKARKADGLPELDIALENIAITMGGEICNKIAKQPWRAYIVEVNEKTATISSGSQVGVKYGNLFDIFSSGTILKGAAGQRFHAPGHKIGELKITDVKPGKAQAFLTDGKMKQGDYIKFK